MRSTAIEHGNLVPAAERILHLEWAGEAGATQNQNAQALCRFVFSECRRKGGCVRDQI